MRTSTLFRTLLACSLFGCTALRPAGLAAQPYRAFAVTNSAGILGIDLNPASIVESRFRFDLVPFGANVEFTNNFVGLRDFGTLETGTPNAFNTSFVLLDGGAKRDLSASGSLTGPSFLLTTGRKSAIAVTSRVRFVVTGSELDAGLMQLLLSGFSADDLLGQELAVDNATLSGNTFLETGFTYGRVLFDKGSHFLKGAVRVKYIQGLGAFRLRFDNARLNFTTFDQALVSAGTQFSLAYTDQIGSFDNLAEPTFGFDGGFVYEWRPNYQRYTYAMDGERDLTYRDRSRYKLRIGVSVIDVGRVTYRTNASNLTLSSSLGQIWDFSNLQNLSTDGVGALNLNAVANSLRDQFAENNTTSEFTIGLPTVWTANVDWSLGRNFFVNVLTVQPASDGTTANRMTATYTLAPRLESRFLDVVLPLSTDASEEVQVGAAVRVGPVLLGTNTGITSALRSEIASADVYFAARLGLRYGRTGDRDRDQVSNGEDECPGVPGTWEFRGCPDTDGDHVPDKTDRCPEEPGLPGFFGCPDSDGDGLSDPDDACPLQAGEASNKGCPAGVTPPAAPPAAEPKPKR